MSTEEGKVEQLEKELAIAKACWKEEMTDRIAKEDKIKELEKIVEKLNDNQYQKVTKDVISSVVKVSDEDIEAMAEKAHPSRKVRLDKKITLDTGKFLQSIYSEGAKAVRDKLELSSVKDEDKKPFDLKENEYLDLSKMKVTEEAKKEFVNKVTFACAREMLKVFYSCDLKTHIEQMVKNDADGKEYVFTFQTLENFIKHFQSSLPPSSVKDDDGEVNMEDEHHHETGKVEHPNYFTSSVKNEDNAIGFAEWMELQSYHIMEMDDTQKRKIYAQYKSQSL